VQAFDPVFIVGDPTELVIGLPSHQKRVDEILENTEVYVSLSPDLTELYEAKLIPGFFPISSELEEDSIVSRGQDITYFAMLSSPERDKIPVGRTVYLRAVLGRKDDAFLLPPATIRSFRGRDFVIVLEGERRRRVDVQYDVWLDLAESPDVPSLLDGIEKTMTMETRVRGNAPEAIKRKQDQAERVGLFGVLNIGFLTAGLMPGIGFVLYSYASLRRRFIQLGILQAIGLSVSQLVGYLASEQLLLMGIAVSGGAAIGLGTSYLFVPFLQTGASPGGQIPPFQVSIGWAEAGWLSLGFGLVLFLTTLGTIVYLVRLKVFEAVKLGEEA